MTRRPPSGELAKAAIGLSMPPASWTSTAVTMMPSDGAIASAARLYATFELAPDSNRTAARRKSGCAPAHGGLESLESGDVAARPPIVFSQVGDPVESGFVASLARAGQPLELGQRRTGRDHDH